MKNLKKFLVLFSICVFILAVGQGQGVPKKNPETITITILVSDGKVICDPDPACARLDDTVIWKSDYVFTVDFSKKTPFKEKQFRAKKEEAKQGKCGTVITKEAKEKDKEVKFKYLVAVLYQGEILTVDPDLVIRP